MYVEGWPSVLSRSGRGVLGGRERDLPIAPRSVSGVRESVRESVRVSVRESVRESVLSYYK